MELFVWTDRTGQKEYATIQVEALERWRQWIPTMQAKLDAKDLDPDFFVQLFDACLFGGALRCWTTVDLIDRPSPSLYRSKIQADLERKDHRLTVVLRPDSNTTWTEPTVQHLLSVLLHNMTHAAFWLFAYRCVDCKCLRTEAMTGSIKVHGPSWMELGQAVEKEADQSRLGFKHQWFMCVEPDHVSRKEELTVVTILQKQKGNSRALANC
ncbi:MAG: hypothetical protein ALECFALPRED_007032 [Alectoria fallacina]|uniref:Uncharacterized protein n=1 Tax=Alectoria fallacina TaxID=1903189 RepID=A0A8H3J055_9LECA|nr:MAG: hypothetical protein ALECFALPRED_007032 [Alectoria fallacina]